MYAVILNGPPDSGKDTLAAALEDEFNQASFKATLIRHSFEWLNVQARKGKIRVEHEGYKDVVNYPCVFSRACSGRNSKELEFIHTGIPFNVEGNKNGEGKTSWSPRMVLQHVSENILKPKFGQACLGYATLDLLDDFDLRPVIFSDGGFTDEIGAVGEKMPTLVVHLHREGRNFEGDSRDYVEDAKEVLSYQTLHVTEGDTEKTLRDLESIICGFVLDYEKQIGRYSVQRLLRLID